MAEQLGQQGISVGGPLEIDLKGPLTVYFVDLPQQLFLVQ
jgi:hypothetical protein